MKMNQVYQKIKEMILYGDLKPGEIITVGNLAESFDVSKTPVRDSLNTLKHEGLIEVLPYKGYMVSRVDAKDLLDLFEMRIILEGSATEMATRHANTAAYGKLMKLAQIEVVESAEESVAVQFQRTNFNFHAAIAKMSGNHYLYDSICNVLNHLQRVLYRDLLTGDPVIMSREHIELMQCMQAGEPEKAKQLAVQQIEETKQRVLASLLIQQRR
jgi:DNA-binding GntR family transcriptional regulator